MWKRGTVQYGEKRKEQTREILEDFKRNSDRRLRPFMNDTNLVRVQVHVVGIGPIDDLNEDYAISMFLRLNWTDWRLAFNKPYVNSTEKLRLNGAIAERLGLGDKGANSRTNFSL